MEDNFRGNIKKGILLVYFILVIFIETFLHDQFLL